jgi:NAD(P)-dependent dehydrogenase (short-subunit alcohol dehydrogenase family)
MAGRLEDRVAIVTGAASGIGYGIATRLIAEGANVAIADINVEGAEQAAAELNAGTAERAVAIATDIGERDSIEKLVAAVEERWHRLDIVVNNAALQDPTPFEDLDYELYRAVLRVDIDGALLTTLAAVALLAQSPCPRIVNISSIQGLTPWPDAVAYAAAKGGLINLTRALAIDLAPRGILVNAIAPGFIDTPAAVMADGVHEHQTQWFKDVYIKYGKIPAGRPGQPADIAGPALFLCSEDCAYMTGQILSVDGGISATF